MRYFDLHCDTADAIHFGRMQLNSNDDSAPAPTLYKNDFHVSLEDAQIFEKYVQCYAVFTKTHLTDEEGWDAFLAVRQTLIEEFGKYDVAFIESGDQLDEFDKSSAKFGGILTVEDARILDGRIERVEEMYRLGVRVVTPLWGGRTCIGGAHDTDDGLTKFGRAAVSEMANVGIIPDISHASFRAADEIMDICEKYGVAPIATHMNSYAVCPHSRNLTDERYVRLTKLGGIAGISLAAPHLVMPDDGDEDRFYFNKNGERRVIADYSDTLPHFEHYERLVPGHVCFGCDFDGTGLPRGISGVESVPVIVGAMEEDGCSRDELERVTYGTAFEFMRKHLV